MDILTNKVVGKVRYLGGGRQLVISPDGKMVFSLGRKRATGFEAGATIFEAEGEDRVVQVTRVFSITGKELIRVPLDETPVYMSISPDRAFLDVAVGDKDLRLVRFPIHAQDLISDACSRLGRNLTEAEWARYVVGAPYRKTCIELNPAAAEIQ
jgi:hypothetical protein